MTAANLAPLSTPRLYAEPLHERHLAELVELHLDPEVSRFLGGVRSAEATKTYLATNLAHWDQWGFGLWIWRTHSGAFVGRAGLRHVDLEGERPIEIAYTLSRAHWGCGLASEIAATLTEAGWTRLSLDTIIALVSPENHASCRVVEKLGYRPERSSIYLGEPITVYRRWAPL